MTVCWHERRGLGGGGDTMGGGGGGLRRGDAAPYLSVGPQHHCKCGLLNCIGRLSLQAEFRLGSLSCTLEHVFEWFSFGTLEQGT